MDLSVIPRGRYNGEVGQAGRELLSAWENAQVQQRAKTAVPAAMDQVALLEALLAPDSGPSNKLKHLTRVLEPRFQQGAQGELDLSAPPSEFFKVALGAGFGDPARVRLLQRKVEELVPPDAQRDFCYPEKSTNRLRLATQHQVALYTKLQGGGQSHVAGPASGLHRHRQEPAGD